MQLYRFTNIRGNPAAINFSEIGDMHQKGDDVLVRWGGTHAETTMIPNITVEELVQWIEDFAR